MGEDNIPVTNPDVAAAYDTIREAREQALRLQQRLRGVAAFIGRVRPSSRRQPPRPRRDRRYLEREPHLGRSSKVGDLPCARLQENATDGACPYL